MGQWRLGYRTMKTAAGAAIAVLAAQLLQLDFYVSAGILTILCIQKTRKKSFQSSWERLAACLIILVMGAVIFEVFNYAFWSIALVLLLFIPLTVRLQITSGIVTSAVIMFHLYTAENITTGLILNELALITIGLSTALVMNIYIPSNEEKLDSMQDDLEEQLAVIFHEFAAYIREGEQNWTGEEITRASDILKEAKNEALQNLENHIMRYEDTYYHYFKMREKQLDIIEQMMPLLTTIDYHVEQADMLASYMDELADGVNPRNTAYKYIDKLDELKESFKTMPLPETREEFEARAALAHLVRELEQYLAVKKQFKRTKEYGMFEAD
ncbi:aromatic acid exporter family protein [Alkalicoccus chagannorensis]|uniref:aromatic acid exporter family protein n=1 Tax=Alkalicoccus chagannorensis TaxID=427072 RepID=UPI000417886B|nr:aromatic acid exporter family protein [Alkalicoccus chagannorensis]